MYDHETRKVKKGTPTEDFTTPYKNIFSLPKLRKVLGKRNATKKCDFCRNLVVYFRSINSLRYVSKIVKIKLSGR